MSVPKKVYVTFDQTTPLNPTGVTRLKKEAEEWVNNPDDGWEGDAYAVYQLVEVVKRRKKR